MTATNSKGQLSIPKAEAIANCAMRVNSENEEKASVSSAGFAAQRAGSALVVNALLFLSIMATCLFQLFVRNLTSVM